MIMSAYQLPEMRASMESLQAPKLHAQGKDRMENPHRCLIGQRGPNRTRCFWSEKKKKKPTDQKTENRDRGEGQKISLQHCLSHIRSSTTKDCWYVTEHRAQFQPLANAKD